MHSLHNRACIYKNCGDVEIINVHVVVVFCICHSASQAFFNDLRSNFWSVVQNRNGFSRFLAADKVGYDANLTGEKYGYF